MDKNDRRQKVLIDGVLCRWINNPRTEGRLAFTDWLIWPIFDRLEDIDPSAVRLRDDTPPELRKEYEEWEKARSDALKEGMILE